MTRADKKKSMSAVAKVVLENPLATEREIAEKANVSNGTAHNMLVELEQTGAKNPDIISITDQDLENIKEMQRVVSEKIRNPEEMKGTRIGELAQALREATARYSLFRGTATDKDGGSKESGLRGLSTAELQALIAE